MKTANCLAVIVFFIAGCGLLKNVDTRKAETLCDGLRLISTAIREKQYDQLIGEQQKSGGSYTCKIRIAELENEYISREGDNVWYFARYNNTDPNKLARKVEECLNKYSKYVNNSYVVVDNGIRYSMSSGWGGTQLAISKE